MRYEDQIACAASSQMHGDYVLAQQWIDLAIQNATENGVTKTQQQARSEAQFLIDNFGTSGKRAIKKALDKVYLCGVETAD